MTIIMQVPGRKEQSHARIVEVAARAIRRSGYRGTGVADLMKEAGLTHGGFYAHFASRDALLVEAMQRAAQDSGLALKAAVAQRMAEGEGRFTAFVNTYLHERQLDNAECGCIVAALASEMPRQDDDVRAEARERVRALLAAVQAALPAGTPAAEAQAATATLVGALQLARTLGGKPGKALLAATREALITRHEPGHSG